MKKKQKQSIASPPLLLDHKPYFIVIILLALAYLGCALAITILEIRDTNYFWTHFFGFHELARLGILATFVLIAALVGGVFISSQCGLLTDAKLTAFNEFVYSRKIYLFIIITFFAFLFFAFPNQFINPDGLGLLHKIPRDVPINGTHITHDEMLELFLHSRFWAFTHELWGWDVVRSYRLLSSFAGILAVGLLLAICRLLNHRYSLYVFLGTIAGAHMQLYFGDVENYSLTGVALLFFIWCGLQSLAGRLSLIWTSLALAVAMSFHLLAGFFGLALTYLQLQRAREQKSLQTLSISIVAFVTLLGGVMGLFHALEILPFDQLFSRSHALGHGGTKINLPFLRAENLVEYYALQLNLLFLLWPLILWFCVVLGKKQFELNDKNCFLLWLALPNLAFFFLWFAALGSYNDWNLYANATVPIALFTCHNFLMLSLRYKWELYFCGIGLASLHSYTWIFLNAA